MSSKKKISNNKKSSTPTSQLVTAIHSYSGPLPPAGELERYNSVVPGSADRILQAFEKQSAHRIKQEDKAVSAGIAHEKLGMILGFTLAILFLCTAALFIIFGYSGVGITAFIIEMSAVVTGFVIYLKQTTRRGSKE